MPYASSVGANSPSPKKLTRVGASALAYSSLKMICSAKLAFRPPYSSGQSSPTHRSRPSSFSHSTRSSQAVSSDGPPPPPSSANSPTRWSASHVRTSSRNAASAGVSRKSTATGLPRASSSARFGRYWTARSSCQVPVRSTRVPRPPHYEDTDVRIDKLTVGPFENNVFILRSKGTGAATLLDAANEHELLLDVSRATGVRRVLTTHGHWDHIQAVEAVRDAGIDVGIAPEDASMLPAYDFTIPDDDVIEVGDLRLRTIHTPGHTAGSTCFLLEGHPVLFSGDTLFPGGPGNTSLPGGDFDQIIESIDRRLFSLPGDLLVLPGHGLDTTLDTERPHLQEWIDRGW